MPSSSFVTVLFFKVCLRIKIAERQQKLNLDAAAELSWASSSDKVGSNILSSKEPLKLSSAPVCW